MHFFCPSCWHEISGKDNVCPLCNYNLTEHNLLSFEEKLILGLNHPVKEIRKSIVFLIGQKRMQNAIKELENLFHREEDIFVLIEIIRALKNIGTEESEELLKRLHKNPLLSKFNI